MKIPNLAPASPLLVEHGVLAVRAAGHSDIQVDRVPRGAGGHGLHDRGLRRRVGSAGRFGQSRSVREPKCAVRGVGPDRSARSAAPCRRRARASVNKVARPSSESGIVSGRGGGGLRLAATTPAPASTNTTAAATHRARPWRDKFQPEVQQPPTPIRRPDEHGQMLAPGRRNGANLNAERVLPPPGATRPARPGDLDSAYRSRDKSAHGGVASKGSCRPSRNSGRPSCQFQIGVAVGIGCEVLKLVRPSSGVERAQRR